MLPQEVVIGDAPTINGAIFYTYMHTRNDTGMPFYIGKGKGNRAYQLNPTRRGAHWNRIKQKYGCSVHILARWDTEQEAKEHEVFLISCMKGIGIDIANYTNGGDGTSGYKWNKESRERLSLLLSGVKKSDTHRMALKTKKTITEKLRIKHQSMIGVKYTTEKMQQYLSARNVKKVLCIETGEVFDSAADASRWLISIGHCKAQNGPILRCCKKLAHIAYGYKWTYVQE